jgi:sugar phosphate isomerase/epimerase
MSESNQQPPIALQLYSVRNQAAGDLIDTLRKVASIGYPGVEFAGWHGVSVKEIRGALDETDMSAVAAHIPYARFENEIETVIDELRALNCAQAVVPWLAEDQRPTTHEQVSTLAANLNQWATKLKNAGIGLSYHNHDFEFRSAGSKTIFDLLVEETDASLVNFELDLGWIAFAGFDPATILKRLAGRIPLVHVKDIAQGPDFDAVPVGTGVMDWSALLPIAKQGGAQWFIVEQDNSDDPLADAGRSFTNLRTLLGS